MFVNKKELANLIREAVHGGKDYPTEIFQLKKDIADLKLLRAKEIAELNTTRTMEEREIKHLVKLKEEKLDVENQKKVLDLDKAYSDKLLELQKQYHEKQIAQLDAARRDMEKVHQEILKRLPNINARLEIKDGK